MSLFLLNLKHYIIRMLRDPKEIALLLAIPIGLIIFNSIIAGDIEAMTGITFGDYNILTSFMAPAFLLSFQFFNSFFMYAFLYKDLRGGMRWRLLSAPCTVREFFFPAFIANWLVSIILGVVYIIITALFLNVYWGNLFVLAAVLAIISLIATLSAVLIFLFTSRYSQANTLGYVVGFGLMILSGFMLPLQILGDNFVIRFLLNYGTPLSIGQAAIISSGPLSGIFDGFDIFIALPGFGGASYDISRSLTNIAILAAIALVLIIITIIASRRRKI